MNSEYYYQMYRSMLNESVKQEAIKMYIDTWRGKSADDLTVEDLLRAKSELEFMQQIVKDMWGETAYQNAIKEIDELISNKQKENRMAVKYYSSSRNEWIDIESMNDVHLKNAFFATCREHGCDFLTIKNPATENAFWRLIENNSVAQTLLIEIVKRFAKLV